MVPDLDYRPWKIDGHAIWFEPDDLSDAGDGWWNLECPPSCGLEWTDWKTTTVRGEGGFCAQCEQSAPAGEYLCNICRKVGEWVHHRERDCPFADSVAYQGAFDLWHPALGEDRPNVSRDPDNPTLIAYYIEFRTYHNYEYGYECEEEAGWVVAPQEAINLYRELKFLP